MKKKRFRNLADVDRMIDKMKSDTLKDLMSSLHN